MPNPVVQVERQADARALNAILNDPDVAPFVGGRAVSGAIDLSPAVDNPNNVNLIGEHGGMLCVQIQQGIYEIHTHVRRAGRGVWAVGMVRAALKSLFTSTDAAEILTRCPKGNVAARAMIRAFKMNLDFTAPSNWVRHDGVLVDADVYSMTIQDWARGDRSLVERGDWFYRRFAEELTKTGRSAVYSRAGDLADADATARAMGLFYEMTMGGQAGKAQAFYGRWSHFFQIPPIEFLTLSPPTINLGGALVILRNDDLWVPLIEDPHPTRQ